MTGQFPHPSASSDISPIEPVWHLLKEKIRARPYFPTNKKALKIALWEAWDGIIDQNIDNYVVSMGKRVQALIAAKGGHTKY